MRNEYTDYIAHGHKYFAVVDLGKKNSKGTKLRRYFNQIIHITIINTQ